MAHVVAEVKGITIALKHSRFSLMTLLGIERMNALPALLFSHEALVRLVGFTAPLRHEPVSPPAPGFARRLPERPWLAFRDGLYANPRSLRWPM
jgi:hypothetical protein